MFCAKGYGYPIDGFIAVPARFRLENLCVEVGLSGGFSALFNLVGTITAR